MILAAMTLASDQLMSWPVFMVCSVRPGHGVGSSQGAFVFLKAVGSVSFRLTNIGIWAVSTGDHVHHTSLPLWWDRVFHMVKMFLVSPEA